jgi:hypothetical protein
VKLWRWTAREGSYLPKKICVYQALSLSLSLSLSPPLEKRARGEVGGSRTLVGSNHPSLLYLADARLHTSLEPSPPLHHIGRTRTLLTPAGCPRAGGTLPVSKRYASAHHLLCWGLQAGVDKVRAGPLGCNSAGSPAIARAVLERPKKFCLFFLALPTTFTGSSAIV